MDIEITFDIVAIYSFLERFSTSKSFFTIDLNTINCCRCTCRDWRRFKEYVADTFYYFLV